MSPTLRLKAITIICTSCSLLLLEAMINHKNILPSSGALPSSHLLTKRQKTEKSGDRKNRQRQQKNETVTKKMKWRQKNDVPTK